MAKTKIISRSVASGSATAVKNKTNNVATSRISKGKIQKCRKNIKGEKTNVTQNSHKDNYLQNQTKIRPCFVNIKLQSSPLCNRHSKEGVDKDTINKHNTATLQDQCTDDIEIATVGNSSTGKHIPKTNNVKASPASPQDKSISNLNRNKTSHVQFDHTSRQCDVSNDINTNNIDDASEVQCNTGTGIDKRKCLVKLNKLNFTCKSTPLIDANERNRYKGTTTTLQDQCEYSTACETTQTEYLTRGACNTNIPTILPLDKCLNTFGTSKINTETRSAVLGVKKCVVKLKKQPKSNRTEGKTSNFFFFKNHIVCRLDLSFSHICVV